LAFKTILRETISNIYSDFFSATFHLLDLVKNICDTLKPEVAESIQNCLYPNAFTCGAAQKNIV